MTISSTPLPLGARERARRAMTEQIGDTAIELFLEHGFEGTTVEDICAATGISRTSFFRYFGSKEEVLLRGFDGVGDEMLDTLRRMPDDVSPWVALRRSVEPLAVSYEADELRNKRLVSLVIDTPALGPLHQDKIHGWVVLLRPEIARRLGGSADDAADPVADALIGSVFACLDAALSAWVADGQGADLLELFTRAVDGIA